MRNLCSLSPRMLTKMPDALEEDHRMKRGAARYPSHELFATRRGEKSVNVNYSRGYFPTHSNVRKILIAPSRQSGKMQYPNTLATRYASIPTSDMRLRSM